MSEGKHHHIHTQDFKVYFLILVALFILTALTVWISTFNFGRWNDVIAIGVAGVKASLVVMFFMHGRFENRMTWAFIYYPLIILGTLLAALFLDYGTRPDNIYLVGNVISQPHHGDESGDHAEGSGDHGSSGDHAPAASHDDTQDHAAPAEGDTADDHAAPVEGDAADGATPDEAHAETADDTGETTETTASTGSGWGDLPGDAAAGKAHAKTICIACHVIDDVGNTLPGAPPFSESANLDRITPEFLRRWFKNPAEIKPGTLMPNLNLSDEQIENLIAFLATYKK